MRIHLQFLINDNTQVDNTGFKTISGKRSSSSFLSIFASCILVPIQIHWVLLGFSFRRLDDIQSLISERVLWSLRTASVASFALQCLYACVSSAYCWTLAPAPPTICRTSAVKSTYNNGPRTDPCGTPVLMTRHSDWRLPIWTDWDRPRTNDSSHSSTRPPKPKEVLSLWRRILWSTESKAADTSSKARTVTSPLSIAVCISDSRRTSRVSVEW